jgi:hypothetical protein
MELNLSELNTMNPYDTFDYNSYEEQNGINYWEKPKVEEKTRKKKVSFNDILSNMNLVVNKQGVLQFMSPNQEVGYNPNDFNQEQQYSQQQYSQQQYSQQQYPQQQYPQQQLQQNKNSQPIDQAVKHSYIYNKYFKDYTDPNAERYGPRVPKTIEEYHQMLLEDRIKAIEHKKMIEQVKSKKMMFTSAPGVVSNPRNLQASKNNLRMMNFR